MSQPNCEFCGRFISWKLYVTWCDYGSYGDTEPPDDSFAHVECYEKLSPGFRNLIDNYTWHPPQIVGENNYGNSIESSQEDSSD